MQKLSRLGILLSLIFILLQRTAGGAGAHGVLISCDASASFTYLAGASSSSSGQATLAKNYGLPVNLSRHTGDLDAMVKRGTIRALVLYGRPGFFYINGLPDGIYYEALQAFEQFVNQKAASKQHIQVTFLPVRPDQVESALEQGLGDVIAYGLIVTPERELRVSFTIPIETGVKQIIVTGKGMGPISSLEDLSGKKVFVNPLSTYYSNLQKVSQSLIAQGKAPILIQPVDKELLDEDVLEMVNAGILPATVTTSDRAKLWASVYPNITPNLTSVVNDEGEMAFAVRKDSPQLKQLLDDFIRTRAVGTSFGNTLLRRYTRSHQFIKNPTTEAEMAKFDQTATFFKKYAAEYGFDYLMIVAQGYQESMLEQSARNGRAVGIMQVEPETASASPINMPSVLSAENNIHAGVKILSEISNRYLNDPAIDPMNRLLFTFAGYNAGPNRIAGLRKSAPAHGLDPNKWFGNVELLAAKEVPVTAQYVSNIYKYYVAYKLIVEQGKSIQ